MTEFSGVFLAKRDEQNGAISPTQIIFLEKLNICYLTESLLIENIRSSSKVNYIIWMLFLFLWKCATAIDKNGNISQTWVQILLEIV